MDKELIEMICVSCGAKWMIRRQRSIRSDFSGLCKRCANKNTRKAKREEHYNWQGGNIADSYGYRMVMVDKDSPYYSMADRDGYAKQHRLIMAEYLGRCLKSTEIVHHINEDIEDNSLVNLALLTSRNSHYRIHANEKYVLKLQAEEMRLDHEIEIQQLSDTLADTLKAQAEEIKRELEENHPYPTSIFVRTAEDTLELMRQHGLTDAEITGINGSACRAGYDACVYNLETYIGEMTEGEGE